MEGADYYCRLHLASGDCHHPVERTQAAVGSAIARGGTISWEQNKALHGDSVEEKEAMSQGELMKHEEQLKNTTKCVDDMPDFS